jgi:lipopolysaccharide transport system ATP-binding protein
MKEIDHRKLLESKIMLNSHSSSASNHQIAISVQNLTKTYKLYNSPLDRLKESLHPLRRQYHHDFHALKDVSFEVRKGETVGIIGMNGSGKSTLLKIITGVITPTVGNVAVHGRISALLELGAGFNPEMTGLENVFFNGMLMGFSSEEMEARIDDILSFADIGEFVNQQVKTYSSGMFVRLAFAVAITIEPEIFVVDEALSVGDAYFQQKCMDRIKAFKEAGGAIIFVSHDMGAVKMLCNRAIFLNHGELLDEGTPENVVQMYNYVLARMSRGEEIQVVKENGHSSFGNLKVEIVKVTLENEFGVDSRLFVAGENVKIRLLVKAREKVDAVVVGILVRDRFGQDIFGTNSHLLDRIVSMKAGESLCFEYTVLLNIGMGKYTLTTAVHRNSNHVGESYHWCDSILNFEVVGSKDHIFVGLAKLEVGLSITS